MLGATSTLASHFQCDSHPSRPSKPHSKPLRDQAVPRAQKPREWQKRVRENPRRQEDIAAAGQAPGMRPNRGFAHHGSMFHSFHWETFKHLLKLVSTNAEVDVTPRHRDPVHNLFVDFSLCTGKRGGKVPGQTWGGSDCRRMALK